MLAQPSALVTTTTEGAPLFAVFKGWAPRTIAPRDVLSLVTRTKSTHGDTQPSKSTNGGAAVLVWFKGWASPPAMLRVLFDFVVDT